MPFYFFIYIILIIPLAEIGFSISLTKGIYIPQFITDELFKTDFGAFFYICIYCGASLYKLLG